MISPAEYLERIVAGIHSVTTSGAEVTWNERINGRQFDVVVRFRLGTLSYLVVVEVRNKTRKASASDLDAFVLKASDQNANKSVFVTAAGFQSGAISVAKEHGVDLFVVSFDEDAMSVPQELRFITLTRRDAPQETPHWSIGEPNLINQIEDITLVYDDLREFDLPNERSQMEYYALKSKLSDGSSLRDLIQRLLIPEYPSLDEKYMRTHPIEPPSTIEPPDSLAFPPGRISAIKMVVAARLARPLHSNIQFDPNILTAPVVYTNAITGEASRFDVNTLPLGVQRVSVGKFYCIMHPLIYYYCDSIVGKEVRWHIVESFQNGNLVQATMTQSIEYSSHYIPVRDRKILDRLTIRLRHMQARRLEKR